MSKFVFVDLDDYDMAAGLHRKPNTTKPQERLFMPRTRPTPSPNRWSSPNTTFFRGPQTDSMSIPRDRLIRKEAVLNMFINEAAKQLLGVFGNSVHRLSFWLLDRSKALAHHCGRCGRRTGKYCKIASAPAVGQTHRYRVCRKCCDCSNGLQEEEE
ncbi:hypothetical protein DdX_00241 [Ditylenchus destructor]|uniref:Uncharacterized protein n=1 Tax=Ditylenchus destructor TaxID=166010 RepID=A0AAD4NGN0_9BILA|nr:hypothetical protein DdX_00241 [Ditylenchus destructor]